MANQLLTATEIARRANMVLINELVAGNIFYKGYEENFPTRERGDTIDITVPHKPTVREHTEGTDTVVENIVESKRSLKLEKEYYIRRQITAKQLTLSLDLFSERIIEPAMRAMAEQIDSYILSKVNELPAYWAKSDSAPVPFAAYSDMLAARKVANDNKVPLGMRYGIVDTATETAMLGFDNVAQADKRGDEGSALREASIGRIAGIDWTFTQGVQNQGSTTIPTGYLVNEGTAADRAAGVTALDIDTGNGTISVGDVFKINNVEGSYVVQEVSTNRIDKFYPALKGNAADNAAITVVRHHNLGFLGNPEAISYAFAPLAPVVEDSYFEPTTNGEISVTVEMDGSLVSRTRDISFASLGGAAATFPERGVRLCL